MKRSSRQLRALRLPDRDAVSPSGRRFPDGAQYRIEIPSTETPEAFRLALDEAAALGCPVHRVSQGSGIQMLGDDDIREMARIGAEHRVEVCLFVTPRANFDTGGLWSAPSGKIIGWQARGADQVRYALDDINRAVDLGIRSVLISDFGLLRVVGDLRRKRRLPPNLVVKSSAILAPGNPATCALLESLGATTINVATDLSVAQLSAVRKVVKAPLDLYLEAPDGLGGFVRHHEAPDMIRYAAPVYLKLGLRNSPDIYPSGHHLQATALNLTRERVRRSKLVYDLIRREMPGARTSLGGVPDLGIPEA